MTFVIGIQAKDSIIVAADKRTICPNNEEADAYSFHSDECKLHLWDKGVMTGSGELHTIRMANQWLQHSQDISSLPKKLKQIKSQRTATVGQHEQITNSSLICSSNDNNYPQIYVIGLDGKMDKLQSNDIAVLLPAEDNLRDESIWDIKNLSSVIKGYNQFNNNQSWINHYLNVLSVIYKKQSLATDKISSGFHMYVESNFYSAIVHTIND